MLSQFFNNCHIRDSFEIFQEIPVGRFIFFFYQAYEYKNEHEE